MSKYKATIDFSGYTAGALGPKAQGIHDKMLAAAATFTDPDVAMADFQTEIGVYDAALVKRASRATADQIAFDLARHDLETMLAELGAYVNTVAKGDLSIIALSGFPSYETGRFSPDLNPPGAPTGVALRHDTLSGSVVVRYHPLRPRSINEVQTCVGDPNVEANWKPAGTVQRRQGDRSAASPPATTVWFRIRTAGI